MEGSKILRSYLPSLGTTILDGPTMKIFIIHSSGMCDYALIHAGTLELEGHETFVPLRDTEQVLTTEAEIIASNLEGIKWSDECHLIWDLSSLGSVFDMGCAYALGKRIKVINVKTHHWTRFVSRREGKYLVDGV